MSTDSSTIHNSLKLETTQMSSTDTLNMLHPGNGTLLSNKKIQRSDKMPQRE